MQQSWYPPEAPSVRSDHDHMFQSSYNSLDTGILDIRLLRSASPLIQAPPLLYSQ